MNSLGLRRISPGVPLLVLAGIFAALVSLTGLRIGSMSSVAALSVPLAADRRPNIVMLMTDDQTVADLRFMPNTRRLIADQGVTFANSFVSYPMCCPSRTTYFTGQYAHNHGVLYNKGPHGGYPAFAHADTSFPAALQRAGYYTMHIGKYLNGFEPAVSGPQPAGTTSMARLTQPPTTTTASASTRTAECALTPRPSETTGPMCTPVWRQAASVERRGTADRSFSTWPSSLRTRPACKKKPWGRRRPW
jgi:hypothetical protein